MQQLSYVHGTSPTPLIGQTVGRYFDEACARHPEREAVVVRHQNVRLTFAEFRARYMAELFRDTVGFGGSKMLRRMMGIVSVWDITSIADLEQRAIAERYAIRIGTRWVLERSQMRTIEDMISVVSEEVASN